MDQVMEQLKDLAVTQSKILANQDNQQNLLEKHSGMLDRQNDILLRNTITVELHEKRSTALEAALEIERTKINNLTLTTNSLSGLPTLIKTISLLLAIAVTIYQMFKFLK